MQHPRCMLLFLVLMVNSTQFQILHGYTLLLKLPVLDMVVITACCTCSTCTLLASVYTVVHYCAIAFCTHRTTGQQSCTLLFPHDRSFHEAFCGMRVFISCWWHTGTSLLLRYVVHSPSPRPALDMGMRLWNTM